MKQRNCIPRLELNTRCKTAFAKFGMSDKAIKAHLARMRLLNHFMEDRGYDSYDKDVGEAFCLFLREKCNYTYQYRKTHFDYITLLNLVVDDLPYSARFREKSDYTQPDTVLGRIANAFFEKMERERYGHVSINQYKLHLKKFSLAMESRGKEPGTIDRYDVLDFMNSSDVAFVRRLSFYERCCHLIKFLKYMNETGTECYIPRPPKAVHCEFIPYIFSEEEMAKIFKAADEWREPVVLPNSYPLIMPVLLRLLYSTGMRIGEACALNNRDINFNRHVIYVRDTKNRCERLSPINESLEAVLKQYISYRDMMPLSHVANPESPFFVSLRGNRAKRTYPEFIKQDLSVTAAIRDIIQNYALPVAHEDQ